MSQLVIRMGKSTINWDQVVQKRVLGRGIFGTAYRAVYQDEEYVLKRQKILPEQRDPDLRFSIWREIDFYQYINRLPPRDRKFFSPLHGYRILECNHKQKRTMKLEGEFREEMRRLDRSPWCFEMLIDFKGVSLQDFLRRQKLTRRKVYSFCYQIAWINHLIHKGGYWHRDLHMGNIMVEKTKQKKLRLGGFEISTYGYQLSAIDYGFVLHRKYQSNSTEAIDFVDNKSGWFHHEMLESIMNLLFQRHLYWFKSNKKKKFPWRMKGFPVSYLQKLRKRDPVWWKEQLQLLQKKRPIVREFLQRWDNDVIPDHGLKILSGKSFLHTMEWLDNLEDPREYAIDYGWISHHRALLPEDEIEELIWSRDEKHLLRLLRDMM